ncbi:MAG TPA: glycosyltransferase [Acidimicrobiales bacterium]|nr:glycosyltransferase [Acidimicrobiales bacterium]
MSVRAIVVHWEQPRRCRSTVEALQIQAAELDIVVVDNASSPAARSEVEAIEGVRLLDAGRNAGFGGGANVGLRDWLADASAGEWALVVPHDAEPADDCLAVMLEAVASVPEAGLVSAEYAEAVLPRIHPYLGGLWSPCERGEGWQPADYAHGTFLLLRRGCLEQVGLFDEAYFAYCEEADLALRARAAGWQAGIVWGAVVHNPHQGNPPPLVDYLMVRNTLRLVRTHYGLGHATIRLLWEAVSLPWHVVWPGSQRSPWFSGRARVLAMRDAVLGRSGPPPASLQRLVP